MSQNLLYNHCNGSQKKVASCGYEPDFVSPPGETLRDILEDRAISQADLAARMGRPKKTINEVIQGKAAITHDTALQLEMALGVPASFWNERERRYREYLAKVSHDNGLKRQIGDGNRW